MMALRRFLYFRSRTAATGQPQQGQTGLPAGIRLRHWGQLVVP